MAKYAGSSLFGTLNACMCIYVGRESVPSTQPLENTESSTQQPASEVSSQLGDLLKELMALN